MLYYTNYTSNLGRFIYNWYVLLIILVRGENMSRPGLKTISVDKEFHEKVKNVAKRNGMDIKDVVEYTFRKTFPNDFPERVIA